jgi:hypothetical protein
MERSFVVIPDAAQRRSGIGLTPSNAKNGADTLADETGMARNDE